MRLAKGILALLTAAWLVGACGNDGEEGGQLNATPSPAPQEPPRGVLLESPAPRIASYSELDLLARLGNIGSGQELLRLAYTPQCSIEVYRIRYQTVGGQGEATTASGALMVPTGTRESCQGARPILLYAHGTADERSFDIANLESDANAEGILIAALFAAQGYIVVAPNYVGYDSSASTYHPYLNADQQSKDMIDALRAARSALPVASAPGVTDGGRLFITGYSQGGHVAMATHRAMEASGATVTASAPMSGPYALSAFGDAIFRGNVSLRAPLNVALLITSYQRAYGNLYSTPTEVFEARYANGIETLLPSTVGIGTLYGEGRLPRNALFNATPPDAVFAPLTPPMEPGPLASIHAQGFGSDNLITNAFRLAYLQDAQANPDGGFPTSTNGLPPANPTHPFRQALKRNDLRNWTPSAPMLLCGGSEDPTVFFLNTQLMQNYWASNAPNARVTVLDVDSPRAPDDPYASLKESFALAEDLVAANAVIAGARDGGRAAVMEAYHGALVPPFCLSAVKSFFDRS